MTERALHNHGAVSWSDVKPGFMMRGSPAMAHVCRVVFAQWLWPLLLGSLVGN